MYCEQRHHSAALPQKPPTTCVHIYEENAHIFWQDVLPRGVLSKSCSMGLEEAITSLTLTHVTKVLTFKFSKS